MNCQNCGFEIENHNREEAVACLKKISEKDNLKNDNLKCSKKYTGRCTCKGDSESFQTVLGKLR